MTRALGPSSSPRARARVRGVPSVDEARAVDAFFGASGDDAFWGRDGRTKRADRASNGRAGKGRKRQQPANGRRGEAGRPTRGREVPANGRRGDAKGPTRGREVPANGRRGDAKGPTRGQKGATTRRRVQPPAAPAVGAAAATAGHGMVADQPGWNGRPVTRGRGDGGGPGGAADPFDGRGPGGPRGRGRGGNGSGGRGGDEGAGRKRSLLWRWRRPLFLVALVGLALLAAVGAFFASTELPAMDRLAQTSYICAADVSEGCDAQNAMAKLQDEELENRTNVNFEDLPEALVQAVVAVEDRDFFEHKGIDPMGIARALYRDIRGQGFTQGGSTITQQFVKNMFLSSDRALSRKVKEAVLSVKLEQRMSKEEILEGYLNTIYFGRGAYGVAAASQAYFRKDVRDIGLAEATYLAGLIRAPALAEASEHPDEARRRRRTALEAMEQEGYITPEQVEMVDAVPFEKPYLVPPPDKAKLVDTLKGGKSGTPYVTMFVKQELKRLGFTDQQIDTGGLRVYTSLRYKMQEAAWKAVTETLTDPGDPEAALVAVDDKGLVRAMVGSRHAFTPNKHENNFAVRGLGSDGRQTGSIFKAVALAEAVRRDISLDSRFRAPGELELDGWLDEDGNPQPVRNYDESEKGVLSIYEATKQSSNTAYAQLMLELGPQSVADLGERMGVGGGKELDPNPSLVLGTANTTPLEMAGAFSTFPNRGVYKRPEIVTRVEQVDQDGNVTLLYQRQVTEERILPETKADLVNHTLQGVIEDGTGTGADIGKPAGGKTGTAQNYWDAWFAGFVPKLTAVVWMGYKDGNIPMENVQGVSTVTGGSLPATIWQRFMSVATGDSSDEFVKVPPEALEAGKVLNENLLTSKEQATTTLLPPFGQRVPGQGGGRPGRGRPQQPTTTTSTPTTISGGGSPIWIGPTTTTSFAFDGWG